MRIAKFGLRAKFLLVRIAIAVALTIAVIFVVRFQFSSRADRQIFGELRQCEDRYLALQAQMDAMHAQYAAILATTPEMQKLPASAPSGPVQRLPSSIARDGGADFVVLADASGKIGAADLANSPFDQEAINRLITEWPDAEPRDSFWTQSGKLCRIHRQALHSTQSSAPPTGVVVVGTEVGSRLANELGAMCSCDVAFVQGGAVVSSTLGAAKQNGLSQLLGLVDSGEGSARAGFALDHEPYRASIISLGTASTSPELVTLKSFESTRRLQSEFTRLMIALALVAMVIGFFLVLRVSDTFSKPLGNLVQAVRALEKGDFSYPVKVQRGDELAEVTESFTHMRSTLKDTQEQLLKNERLATIGQMASSISHDLRHQFTTIVANSEFLSEPTLPAEQRRGFYEEIRQAVDQLNDLVESLLEFSRGREEPRLVQVNLEDVVDRAVRSVRSRPEFRAVEIVVRFPAPIECLLDPSKMERALTNLLINSCQACESRDNISAAPGSVEVSVSGLPQTVEVRVTDNGPGISEMVRESLFQPFVSHGKSNGTGLGLAIVRKVCRDQGGDAVLESSEPGRTVFTLTIPLSRQAN